MSTHARTHVVVPMPDGTIYDIVPLGSDHRRGPRHRIYRREPTGFRTFRHRRVTADGEQARVAARLAEMRAEAKRDIAREQRWGAWLTNLWRAAMVFTDQMRAWWRGRRIRAG